MIDIIKNEFLEIGINSLGAEMEYINYKGNNLLHERDNVWNGQNPVLFPMIGRLIDGKYTFVNKTFFIDDNHGFARRKEFKLVSKTEKDITFVLSEDDSTLKIYPFKFLLFITYSLSANVITTKFKVTNTDSKLLFFNIGAHPAFKVDGQTTIELEEPTKIYFNRTTCDDYLGPKLEQPVTNKFEVSRLLNDNVVLFTDSLKEVSFKGKYCLITLQSHLMPFLSFWQKNPTNPEFLCIEPWCGIPPRYNSSSSLENKDGILSLKPLMSYETAYTIIID